MTSSLPGMEYVDIEMHIGEEAEIVTCCGCGFPVDQNNVRCLVMDPDAYMGTYGPCCAPTGWNLRKLRRQWAKRRAVR